MSFLSTLKGSFNLNKLLCSLSNYLKLEKKSKDTLLFRYGNKGNKFYVVLKGEVSVLILKEVRVNISFNRYFLHLLLLKMLKEDELLKKIITANSKIKYHFDERDFDSYYEKIVNFVNKHMTKFLENKKNLKENSRDKKIEQNKIADSKTNSEIDFNNDSINENENSDIKSEYKSDKDSNKDKDINDLRVRRKKTNTFLLNNNFVSKFLNWKKSKEEEKLEEEEEEQESEDKEINYQILDLPFFNLDEIKEIIHYYIYKA